MRYTKARKNESLLVNQQGLVELTFKPSVNSDAYPREARQLLKEWEKLAMDREEVLVKIEKYDKILTAAGSPRLTLFNAIHKRACGHLQKKK